ncbi:hypothetical protein [Paenibacillus sp. YN15]|uniref:hypothetical protein n=1 Tax=Paenibacillus sp. YN15 TaxID=1742774 RepID=UPI0026BCAB86|nr:hypothetical protein [Paenibacillus sp. YN15]
MEKNVLAYFKTQEEAREVLMKLQVLRVAEARIDRVTRYPQESREIQINPITGNVTSLAELTQDAVGGTHEAGVLMAADPAASGMSLGGGGGGGVTGRDILLTAIVDESIHPQVLHLVEQTGGIV